MRGEEPLADTWPVTQREHSHEEEGSRGGGILGDGGSKKKKENEKNTKIVKRFRKIFKKGKKK